MAPSLTRPPEKPWRRLTFAAILMLAGVLRAEEPLSEDPPLQIPAARPDTVVQGLAAPAGPSSISVIGKKAIQDGRLQLTLAESLETEPGIFILNPYNFAQDTRIAVRGFGARSDFGIRGIRLYVDGIPATTPDGQGEVDGIDLSSTGRITVLRGPSSALYGSAAGGAILIETEKPPLQPTTEVRVLGGSYGLFQLQGKAGTSWAKGGAVGGISHLQYDGYRENARTQGTRFNAKVTTEALKSADLTLVANLIDLPQQDDPGGLTLSEAREDPRQARERNLLFDAGEEVRQQRIGLLWEQNAVVDRNFVVRSYYTHRDFANRLPFLDGGQVSFERHFAGGGLLYSAKGERLNFQAGADLDFQRDHRYNYDNLFGKRGPVTLDQIEEVGSFGTFGRIEWPIGRDWSLEAALRFDTVGFDVEDRFLADGDDSGARTFTEWSPFVGTSWTPVEGQTLFANLSRSFETPTTTELDNPDGGGFNENLDPQTAVGIEAGARGVVRALDRSLGYRASVFHQWIDDALVPFELPRFPEREFYRNAASSRFTGLELSADIELAKGLTLLGAYTWSHFRYDDFVVNGDDYSGNTVPGIPEHFGTASLAYEATNGFEATWTTRFVGKLEADDANTTTVDGSTVTDLRAGWTLDWSGWTIYPFAGIQNLFNESYFANIRINAFGGRYYEPAPERAWFAGLRVSRSF